MSANEVSLYDLINERFAASERNRKTENVHLGEQIDALRADIRALDGKLETQRGIHEACILRQKTEQANIWDRVNQIGDKQTMANGIREGEIHAMKNAKWDKYVEWVRVGSVGAILAVLVMILIKLV